MIPRDYAKIAHQYARDVVAGKVLTSRRTTRACERHLRDLTATRSKDYPYTYNEEAGARVCLFLEQLVHVKGRWALKSRENNPRVTLAPWQCFAVCVLFGWLKRSSGKRRYRKASIYVPRKNGKSFLAAGIALYMAFADAEPGAEVYSGATSEKQAWEVFGPARRMALAVDGFTEALGVTVAARSLMRPEDGSKLEPIIGKPGDGSSPHCAVVDEYHEHDTSELYDTMLTGMGAREQPLLLVITTAGANLSAPCYDDYLTCCKILDGTLDAPDHFALIYEADKEDDWSGETALIKANPNYNVSVDGEFLRAQQRDAITQARRQNAFKTKHLNVWVNARDAFVNMAKWAACERTIDWAAMRGRDCIMALDLASKVDLASKLLLFLPTSEDPRYYVRATAYLPSETIEDPRNEHYRDWRGKGHLVETEGNIIDYTRVWEDILEDARTYNVLEIAYDPYQATMLVNQLLAEGLPAIEFKQTVLNFSEPMKQVDGMIRAGRLAHDGDPVLTWCCSNVEAKVDAKDNVYPRKAGERQENKIDHFVALVMAMGRAIAARESQGDLDGFLNDPVWVTV